MKKASVTTAVVLFALAFAGCDAYVRSRYKRNYFRVLPLITVLDAYQEKHASYPRSVPRPIAEIQELRVVEECRRLPWLSRQRGTALVFYVETDDPKNAHLAPSPS